MTVDIVHVNYELIFVGLVRKYFDIILDVNWSWDSGLAFSHRCITGYSVLCFNCNCDDALGCVELVG